MDLENDTYSASALVNADGGIVGRTQALGVDFEHVEDLVASEDHVQVRGLINKGGGRCAVQPRLDGWPAQADFSLEPLLDCPAGPLWLMQLSATSQRRLALEEMVSVVAHEVKNPLAGISGALEVVGARAAAGSSEARMMLAARQRVRSLDETLEDLLLLTRPLATERMPVDLVIAVEEALKRASLAVGCAAPEVRPHPYPVLVDVDPTLLSRALGYLLDHALREDRVSIEVNLEQCLGGWAIRVSYRNGQLERDIGDRIFDPRYLTRSRRTGLHLPVAARLMRAHGGHISCEVIQGRVILTCYLPQPEATVPIAQASAVSSSMR